MRPATRELRGLRMAKVAVGSYDNNADLLECTGTGERLLIDAAAEAETLLDVIGSAGLGQVLTTHFHFDHWGALAEVLARTGATTLAHPADTVGIPVPTAASVRDGDEVVSGTWCCGRCTWSGTHSVRWRWCTPSRTARTTSGPGTRSTPAANEAGLEQYQVGDWRAWHARVTPAMLAAAYLTVTRATARSGGENPRRTSAGRGRDRPPRSRCPPPRWRPHRLSNHWQEQT